MKKTILFILVIVVLAVSFWFQTQKIELFGTGGEQPFVGPGGCMAQQECEAYCTKPGNFEECNRWCEQNPDICGKYKRGGEVSQEREAPQQLETPSPISKPNLTLTYYKGLTVLIQPYTDPNEFIEDAKRLNANIVSIRVESVISVNESWDWKSKAAQLIYLAHKNGLQVDLIGPLYVLGKGKNSTESLPIALEYVRENAKFAQEWDIHQLTVVGEIDNLRWGFNWTDESPDYVERYAQEALREIRKYYNGKVGVGFGNPAEEYLKYNLSGYDYLLGTAYTSREDNIAELSSITSKVNILRKIADKNGINESIVGETGVCDPSKKQPDGRNECWFASTIPVNAEEEALYYEKLFDKTHDLVDGYFVFYIFPVMSVKDEPAEAVIKDWYKRL